MKTTINLHQFRDAFQRMGRSTQFSYEGLEVLFNGLEEYEEDTGEELDFDVIALCCDFAEMSEDEIIKNYDIQKSDDDDGIEEWLWNQTWVLGQTKEGKYVFRQF